MKDWIASLIEASHPNLLIRYRLWRRHASYERELFMSPRWLSKTMTAIDVGGNTGIWAIQLSRFAGQVICFEPNPDCIALLSKTVPANVQIIPIALSDKSGLALFRFDPRNTGIGTIELRNELDRNLNPGIGDIVQFKVKTERLDNFDLKNISFIKIDVEGHEYSVLLGALELIAKWRPVLLLEIEERHNPGGFDQICALLAPFGYQCHVLTGTGKIVPFNGPLPVFAGSEPYVNNFFFICEPGQHAG